MIPGGESVSVLFGRCTVCLVNKCISCEQIISYSMYFFAFLFMSLFHFFLSLSLHLYQYLCQSAYASSFLSVFRYRIDFNND